MQPGGRTAASAGPLSVPCCHPRALSCLAFAVHEVGEHQAEDPVRGGSGACEWQTHVVGAFRASRRSPARQKTSAGSPPTIAIVILRVNALGADLVNVVKRLAIGSIDSALIRHGGLTGDQRIQISTTGWMPPAPTSDESRRMSSRFAMQNIRGQSLPRGDGRELGQVALLHQVVRCIPRSRPASLESPGGTRHGALSTQHTCSRGATESPLPTRALTPIIVFCPMRAFMPITAPPPTFTPLSNSAPEPTRTRLPMITRSPTLA